MSGGKSVSLEDQQEDHRGPYVDKRIRMNSSLMTQIAPQFPYVAQLICRQKPDVDGFPAADPFKTQGCN